MGLRPPRHSFQGERVQLEASFESLATRVEQTDCTEVIFYALAMKDDARVLGVLLQASDHHDWRIRRLAAEVFGVREFGEAARQRLVALLADSSEYVVRTACETLGILEEQTAHDPICALLQSSEPATRAQAVRSLRALFRAEDYETLLRVSERDRSRAVGVQAAECLYAHETGTHWRELFGLWSHGEYHHKRVWACRLALRFGDAGVLAPLKEMQQDGDGHVRRAATRAAEAILEGNR